MLIVDQFGIIQNLQTLTIPQTSFMVGTFFCRFLHQDSSKSDSSLTGSPEQSVRIVHMLKTESSIANH